MSATDIAIAKGADVFVFDYDHLDVVYTVALGSGSWGNYQASNVAVASTLIPQTGSDGVTSVRGTYRTSILLAHLTTFTSARVHFDGQGFTMDYTLDSGTTWTALPEDGVIPLSANADFDLRVTFPGNIANDPAVVNSITVYILRSETMQSSMSVRTLTFHKDPLTSNGIVLGGTGPTVAAANTNAAVDPKNPNPPTTPADYTFGTIEMWITPSTSTVFSSAPAGTVYKNGVAATPTAGVKQHVVLVLSAKSNAAFTLSPNCTVSHLAVYPQQMTSSDVAALYAAQSGNPSFSVSDVSTMTVTENSPATLIYAYTWQIQSG